MTKNKRIVQYTKHGLIWVSHIYSQNASNDFLNGNPYALRDICIEKTIRSLAYNKLIKRTEKYLSGAL